MKKKRKRRLRKEIKIFLIFVFLMTSVLILWQQKENACTFEISEDLNLHSKSALLFRADSGRDCFKKNEEELLYPASLAKLMSAYAVLEEVSDLNQEVILKNEDLKLVYEQNASSAYLKVGEAYSIEDLLYASILPSGADATSALERFISEEGKDLVTLMNEAAQDLKMKNSAFSNASGLFDPAMVTSAKDLKKLVLALYEDQDGKALIGTTFYKLNDDHHLNHTFKRYGLESEDVLILGGKTGYIDEVGENLFVLFEYEGKPYGLILLGADGNPYQDEYLHTEDALKIFENLKGQK